MYKLREQALQGDCLGSSLSSTTFCLPLGKLPNCYESVFPGLENRNNTNTPLRVAVKIQGSNERVSRAPGTQQPLSTCWPTSLVAFVWHYLLCYYAVPFAFSLPANCSLLSVAFHLTRHCLSHHSIYPQF